MRMWWRVARDHAAPTALFLLGMLVGGIAGAAISREDIPNGVATLVGSALGAAIAVLGAAWVADGTERRVRREFRSALEREIMPYQVALHAVAIFLLPVTKSGEQDISPGVRRDKAVVAMSDVAQEFKTLVHALEQLKPVFVASGVVGMTAYLRLLRGDDGLGEAHKMLEEPLPTEPDQAEQQLATVRERLHEAAEYMTDAAVSLAPDGSEGRQLISARRRRLRWSPHWRSRHRQ